jgi:hypothetical protein
MESPGPDGFLRSSNDPLYAAHRRLNDFLIAEDQRSAAQTPVDVTTWRKLPKQELIGQTLAVLRRLRWLH